jgi:RNA polymerase sigma factor (sigma-70 family)
LKGEDTAEFARAYEDNVWAVYGFVGYRVSGREQAEDLTQQTFERALRAWRSFDPERASLRAWLLSIARNLVVDHHRREGRRRHSPVEGLEGHPDLVAAGPEGSLGIDPDLEAALGRLGERDREILALRFGGDLSGPEIAELTELNLANVQQILSRSLRKLRAELEGGRSGREGAGARYADRSDRQQRRT